MHLHAASRPTSDTTAPAHTWTLEGADHADLLAQARAEVPAGHVLLHTRVEK